jgi:hypothetical protein
VQEWAEEIGARERKKVKLDEQKQAQIDNHTAELSRQKAQYGEVILKETAHAVQKKRSPQAVEDERADLEQQKCDLEPQT